ncbi:MAG: DUF349 domain-containing protein [Acidobacteria bacterium]|nr:DUF349 domain-containing protein [Acidobacteriota bacterium]
MALLDRFRAHPGHKHPDAAVRLAFVQELPLEERELLTEVAREDADPKVRRAAVAKLLVPPALAGVARDDADEGVRAHAVVMLRDLALEAFEGVGEPESAAAVDALAALPDARALVFVARTAPREATAVRALASIGDAHALGSLARHADHDAVRRAAFEALRDHGEILGVALNSDFKDPTLAAVERITDRAELEQIATRAKNKSAARRARALAREIDERTAQAAADAAAAAAPPPEPPDPAELERIAREDAERARAREEAARHVEEARAREEAGAAHRREAQAAADRAKQDAAAALAQKEAERVRARLAELADEAARIAQLEDLAAARRVFTVIRKEWHDLHGATAGDPALVARYTTVEEAFTTRDSAAYEADQRARRDALVRLQQLVTRVEPLTTRADLSLKAGERAIKDLRAALGAMPQLPSKRDYEDMLRRLKALLAALTPRVQELRDVADWQRWANVGIQEQLCEKMEALKGLEDPEEAAKFVRTLQEQWRQAADVPRAQGEALWKRFKAAHDEVWARCEAHFAAQAEARAANLAKKIALCERAEALADSTKWIETADEIKKLQAEWKTIGAVTRGQEKAIWERFRVPCDRFFSRRHEDLAQRKSVWAENLAKKEALCVKVEALVNSTEWDAAANEIKRLQAEWKTIGPVKKSRSEPLWQRFRGACDQFFSRYVQRHDIALGARVAAREAICAELEALAATSHQPPAADAETTATDSEPPATDSAAPATAVEPPADLVAQVRALRGRWQSEIAARGVDRDHAMALDQRYIAAFAGVIKRWPSAFSGTDLDPDSNRKRMETLVLRMEDLATSLAGPIGASKDDAALSPTNRLAAMLKEALAANTIGGRVDDGSRWRAAEEDVRQTQASWSRIGPVPEDTRRALADRFQRAIRRIAEGAGRAGVAGGAARAGGPGRPGGARAIRS